MMPIHRQLVLDLVGAPRYDRDDFLVSGANQAAVTMLDAWPHWPGPAMLLVGPPGSGKSHLAALWAGQAEAAVVCGALPPTLWDGGGCSVVLEDADRCPVSEPELFHALNLAGETNGSLLVTARTPPISWALTTPDLLSRLRLASTATLEPPDGELLKAVLVKLFADRQIRVEADVVAYAALHCEQSLEAAAKFVHAIDEASLSEGRRITRPLAAATLAALGWTSD